MSRTAKVIRATSDSLLRDLETLEMLELEKRRLAPDDPELVSVAARIEELATRVLQSSHDQRALTEQIEAMHDVGDPDAPTTPIEEAPRDVHAILARWREAEREVEATAPGSVEHETARQLARRLRDEYREATRPR
jgi:hypothetical protein